MERFPSGQPLPDRQSEIKKLLSPFVQQCQVTDQGGGGFHEQIRYLQHRSNGVSITGLAIRPTKKVQWLADSDVNAKSFCVSCD